MRATIDLIVTFDYRDEFDYAETLVSVMDRARELCRADIVGPARRDAGQATDDHIAAPPPTSPADPASDRLPAPTLPDPSEGLVTGRLVRNRRAR